jgi:predicted PolB exonuclease-like 3'-5' exonuclease
MTKDSLQKTLFLDIETVTAQEKYEQLDPEWQKLWDEQFFRDDEVSAKTPAERYLLKGSLRGEFSKIICLSLGTVIFKDNEPHIYVKSLMGEEKDILTKFAAAAAKYEYLAAHNGKNFDFPFMTRRYIANGMPIPKLLDTRGLKPWDIKWLYDTQEMWRFGDLAYPSLDLLAKILGFPLKNETDLDGSKIHDAYYVQKDYANISKYCALDVVRLIRVYVKLNNPSLDITNYTLA